MHVGQFTDEQRLIVLGRDDKVADVARRLALGVDNDLIGEGRLFDAADWLQSVYLGDLVGEVGGGQTGGQQRLRPRLYFDLAQVAASHIGIKNIRNILDARSQVEMSEITQLSRAIAAGQH